MEVIKKYPNRKLYSLKANGYVTLNYINDLVRSEASFSILEHKTLKDVTNDVLKQSILLLDLDAKTLRSLIKG
jgi:polyhydroxyalkanoate synthesis regulator protein